MGTFWFRTRHRRSEISLRMAMGSSRSRIRSRLLGEGLLLLVLAAIPALIICGNLVMAEAIMTEQADACLLYTSTGGELIRQVFFENFVLTLLAGVVGLALSYAATFLLNDFLFSNSTNAYLSGETCLLYTSRCV